MRNRTFQLSWTAALLFDVLAGGACAGNAENGDHPRLWAAFTFAGSEPLPAEGGLP